MEFFNCHQYQAIPLNQNSLPLNTSSSCYLQINYLLKDLTLTVFNVFVEHLYISGKSDASRKTIFCLQSDMSQCHVNMGQKSCVLQSGELLGDESVMKSIRLKKRFSINDMNSTILEEMKDESVVLPDVCFKGFKLDKNQVDSDDEYFLINVVNKDAILSATNPQFKGKLRARIKVEMRSLTLNEDKFTPINVVLALMGNYLYFYHFLYIGNSYLLKTGL